MNSRNQNKTPINRQIRAPRVRVIFEDTNQVMSLEEALHFASSQDMDLVQFNFGDCPTCRVLNYSKYKYQEEKKRKQEAGAKSKMKEIQLRPSIDDHDLQVKTDHIISFLEKGNDVRLRMKLRGRERVNSDKHGLLLLEMANKFANLARVEYKLDPASGAPIGGVVTLKSLKMPIKTANAKPECTDKVDNNNKSDNSNS